MMFVRLSGLRGRRGGRGGRGGGGGRVRDHAVSEPLEIVGRRQAPEDELLAAEEKGRRSVDQKAVTLLTAEFDAGCVFATRHASVVLVDVQSRRFGEIVEQASGIPSRLCPGVIIEQLILHLPKLSLLAAALGRMRGVPRVLMNGERIVTHAPTHLPRFDQLLADGRHLYCGKLCADGAFIVDVFDSLDRSEERRVGKECRCRGAAKQREKNERIEEMSSTQTSKRPSVTG